MMPHSNHGVVLSATRILSLAAERAALGLGEGEPHSAHHVELRLEELRVALREGQQGLLGEERGLAIELLPDMVEREVRVAAQGLDLLRGRLELGEGAVPLEGVDDLLRGHGCNEASLRSEG